MIKLKLRDLVRPGFLPAFNKLCADPFTPAEKFRLAKTKRALETELETANGVRNDLIKKHGTDEADYLNTIICRVKAQPQSQATSELLHNLTARMAEVLAGNEPMYRVDAGNAEKSAAFKSDENELLEQEVATFLECPLKPSNNTSLDANDMAELVGLIDV